MMPPCGFFTTNEEKAFDKMVSVASINNPPFDVL